MNNILFLDISGSVKNDIFYWNEVTKIISKNSFSDHYLWNSKIYKSSLYKLNFIISCKFGSEGTEISNVASIIDKNNLYDNNIVIITDGEVSRNQITITENYLKRNIKSVECYIIKNLTEEQNLDISVPLSFMRNSNSKIYLSNYKDFKLIKEIKLEDYKILENITALNIMQDYDKYYDIINILNMGKNGLPIIKQELLNIRNDYIKLSNKSLNKDNGIKASELLQLGNYTEALKIINKIEYEFINNIDNSFITKFNKLLSLCDDRTNSGFSLYQKVNNALSVENLKPDENSSVEEYAFEESIIE